jgi:hypothetical protein
VRLLFRPGERVKVEGAVCRVMAPKTVKDLIKVKTRSRLGVRELAERFPDLHGQSQTRKRYGSAIGWILGQPALYSGVIPYLWVNLISAWRARGQARNLGRYSWERDDSSRKAAAVGGSR